MMGSQEAVRTVGITQTRRNVLGSGVGTGVFAAVGCRATPDAAGPAAQSTGPVTIRAFIGGIAGPKLDSWENEFAVPFRQHRPNVTIQLVS